ncbi:MAG: GNAT family N-acetyltransferase, partial [Pseudomonadota bacterium]
DEFAAVEKKFGPGLKDKPGNTPWNQLLSTASGQAQEAAGPGAVQGGRTSPGTITTRVSTTEDTTLIHDFYAGVDRATFDSLHHGLSQARTGGETRPASTEEFEDMRDHFADSLSKYPHALCFDGDELVGVGHLHGVVRGPDRGTGKTLATARLTHEQYRGKGVQTKLAAQLEDMARRSGAEKLQGLADPKNEGAIGLVKKLGYQKVGEVQGDFGTGTEEIWEKSLV